MTPREASGERCTTPEKTLTFRASRARAFHGKGTLTGQAPGQSTILLGGHSMIGYLRREDTRVRRTKNQTDEHPPANPRRPRAEFATKKISATAPPAAALRTTLEDYVSRIFFFSTGMIAGIRMVTTAPPCFGRRRCAFFNCSPWCGRGGRGLRRDLGDAITFGEECRRSRSCRRRRRSSRRRRRANQVRRRPIDPT